MSTTRSVIAKSNAMQTSRPLMRSASSGGIKAARLWRIVGSSRPGGEIDGRGMFVPGVAQFAQGEKVFLFLTGMAAPLAMDDGLRRTRKRYRGGLLAVR